MKKKPEQLNLLEVPSEGGKPKKAYGYKEVRAVCWHYAGLKFPNLTDDQRNVWVTSNIRMLIRAAYQLLEYAGTIEQAHKIMKKADAWHKNRSIDWSMQGSLLRNIHLFLDGAEQAESCADKIIRGWKIIIGIKADDKDWNRLNFDRQRDHAERLAEFFRGDYKSAIDCCEDIYEACVKSKLNCNLGTVIKHAYDWRTAQGRGKKWMF